MFVDRCRLEKLTLNDLVERDALAWVHTSHFLEKIFEIRIDFKPFEYLPEILFVFVGQTLVVWVRGSGAAKRRHPNRQHK